MGTRFELDGKGLTIGQRGQAYVAFTKRMAGSVPRRVVDKMPGNYHWLGLIDVILPNSAFVHCRRHPLDVCLSQYRINFGGELSYSGDLRNLASAYRQYADFIEYWRSVLGAELAGSMCVTRIS